MNPTSATPSARLYFLDWLRIAAFVLLVFFHVGMYYVTWDFHVKSPSASTALEPWMLVSTPWRMSLLFIVSGAALSTMLRRGADAGLLRARTKRLLLPLLLGVLLIVPPQSYFQVVQQHGFDGGFVDFLGLYFTGFRGFCTAGRCLVLPTWNHLWFLPYVWVYTVLVWCLVRLRPFALDTLAARIGRSLTGPAILIVPIVALTVVRGTLRARFPTTYALVDDWCSHAIYFGMFVAGAVFVRVDGLWDRFTAWRWPALALAAASYVVLLWHDAGVPVLGWFPETSAMQWSALVAVLGFGRRHLDVDHRWRATLTEAVFPVYIVHQTLIIVLAESLLPLRLQPGVEGPILVVGTFVLSASTYLLVRRVRGLRPWFGLSSAGPGRASTRAGDPVPLRA